MKLSFSKMHGIGNDFVVVDGVTQPVSLQPSQLRWIADRHFGVGCDQILLVEKPQQPGVDFRYRIFNADGGEVEQCGNGARCFARFVLSKNLTRKKQIRVETRSGVIVLEVQSDDQVRVNMGKPRLDPELIPLALSMKQIRYSITLEDSSVEFGSVSMGNPHAVLLVENVDTAPVATLGPVLESHPVFPARANIGFMQIINSGHIRLRVFERGVGETLACGTGACAAVVVGRLWNLLDASVQVELPGGSIQIEWQADASDVFLTGPAEFVFEGELELPNSFT